MGNQQTIISYQQEAIIQKFGKVSFVRLEGKRYEGLEFISVEFSARDKVGIFQEWFKVIQELKKQEEIKEFIVLPQLYRWANSSFLCKELSSENRLKVIYSKFDNTLDLQIKIRKQKKISFQEVQIYYTMYVLLKVCSFFQVKETNLGNIHLKNVIINEKREIKVFTIFSSPAEQENYELLKQSRFNQTFLAPQQFSLIIQDQQQLQTLIDHSKIDTFSIGLLLMSMILLNDSCYLYDYKNQTIKKKEIDHLKEQLLNHSLYDKNICHFVYSMLEINPKKRNSPKYYYGLFRRYEKEILCFETFQCQEISKIFSTPKKRHKTQKIQLSTKVSNSFRPIQEQISQKQLQFTFKKQEGHNSSEQDVKKKLFH